MAKEDYGGSSPEPEPEKKSEKKTSTKARSKLSDKQKMDLKKHMDKLKKQGMSPSESKSHRMKMLSRMSKGMSVSAAHKDINK
jgi:hypothetical protein